VEYGSMRASILVFLLGYVLWADHSPLLPVSEKWRPSAMSILATIEHRAEIRLPNDAKVLFFEHQTTGEEEIRANSY
jgi:hypothetical protein